MKLVLLTFGGRECSLKILFHYISKYKKYIHEYRIYVATVVQSDIDFMEKFAEENRDFVRTVYLRINGERMKEQCQKEAIWNMAYEDSQEEDTVYLKLDDDVVYLEETLFTDFIQARINHPEPPLMFPLIVNNSFSSWLLQKKNIIKSPFQNHYGDNWPSVYHRIKPYIVEHKPSPQQNSDKIRIGNLVRDHEILCPIGWGNLGYCIEIHNQFIENILSSTKNQTSDFTSETYWGEGGSGFYDFKHSEPMSVNVCAWLGNSLKKYTETYGAVYSDENWWTIYLPIWTNTNNQIYTKTIVSHYAFYRQRELGLDRTDILDKYWKLCV